MLLLSFVYIGMCFNCYGTKVGKKVDMEGFFGKNVYFCNEKGEK